MALILQVTVLSLLMQGLLCTGQTNTGCVKWTKNGDNVCCEACHPGNRLVRKCGPSPKELCTPCEPGTYTVDPSSYRCTRCTQCVGALLQLEACAATKDTKCGCKEGLTCGNDQCSYCVQKCGKGQEPTKDRSCRPCPEGTFNDQNQQMCKPWSPKCRNPSEYILTKGTAFSDINCTHVSVKPSHHPNERDNTEQRWSLFLSTFITIVLMSMVIIIIIMTTVAVKTLQKKKKTKKTDTKTPIIRTPTDDPRTLIAIECSFHEAQQEQGSSTESLDSKESSDPLIV